MRAYATTVVRPVVAHEIARSTIGAAVAPVARTSTLMGSRRPLLIGLAVVLLLVAVAGAAFVGGQSPAINGVFVEGPSLAAGHSRAALALPDGRVLVGVRSPSRTPAPGALRCTAPCRPHLSLLDPATGVFTLTQDLPPRLPVDSMALLDDGRVLLVDGSADAAVERGATIYDPVADRVETIGGALEPDGGFLVPLADGRVLVGGRHGTRRLRRRSCSIRRRRRSRPVRRCACREAQASARPGWPTVGCSWSAEAPRSAPTAELYDPATDTFTATGPTTVARGGFHSATLLPDGRVLLAGGLVPHAADPQTVPDPTATAELFDPATGTFTAAGSMAAPRYMHAASMLSDGRSSWPAAVMT